MRLHPQLALIADLQFGISCQWDCHVYALRAPGGVVLIDAGSGMAHDALLGNLRQEFGTDEIAGLVLTHTHPDHANGASRFACDVYAPAASKGILEDADEERSGLAGGHRRGAYPMEMRMEACRVHRALEHGESFTVAGQTLQAIHVTGHSEDSFCYVTEMECGRALFCGDAVFYGGVLGLINAPGSSMDSYRTHLGRLRGLDVDCLFPGHGLFTFRKGQRHIDAALQQLERGFVPRMIGQQELIF